MRPDSVQLPNVAHAAAFLQDRDPSRRDVGRRDEHENERTAEERARAAGDHPTADHGPLPRPFAEDGRQQDDGQARWWQAR